MRLILEDGTEFSGSSFGAEREVAGEVVFNTSMAGYVEALTDPSYRGQILVLTYPLVGVYGVPEPRSPGSLTPPYESDRIQATGLVVQQYQSSYSHASARRSLGAWLQEEGKPAVTGIDTRTLTRRLRESGTMKGWLLPQNCSLEEARNSVDEVDMASVAEQVSPENVARYGAGAFTILVVDMGIKDNIIRSLLSRDVSVIRAGFRADLLALAEEADGILLGNGPGDPKDLGPLIAQLRSLMERSSKPIFGICLGHQVLALAAGADTYKLKYGHRGINQPVQDLITRHCYITSQNHGYAVKDESLPESWEPWFVNLNDATNEGIRCRTKPFYSVQFHPEAAPGPQDTGFLFDDFLRLVSLHKAG